MSNEDSDLLDKAKKQIFKSKLLRGGDASIRDVANDFLGAERKKHIEQIGQERWDQMRLDFQARVDDLNEVQDLDRPVLDELHRFIQERSAKILRIAKEKHGPLANRLSYLEPDQKGKTPSLNYELAKLLEMAQQPLESKRKLLFWAATVARLEDSFQDNYNYGGAFRNHYRNAPVDETVTGDPNFLYGVSYLYRSPTLMNRFGLSRLEYQPEILGRPINLTQFTRQEVNYGPEIDELEFKK